MAGCGASGTADSPFAPGVARNEQAVDGMVVGHRLMDAGEYEMAISAFSRAALDQGMTAEVLLGIGSANLGLGRVHTAETVLRDALDKDEKSPEIWNNLGVALMEKAKMPRPPRCFSAPMRLITAKATQFEIICGKLSEKPKSPSMVQRTNKITNWYGGAAATI